MTWDCGSGDPVLVAICQTVAENVLILRPGSAPVDRPSKLAEVAEAELSE